MLLVFYSAGFLGSLIIQEDFYGRRHAVAVLTLCFAANALAFYATAQIELVV